ncbi:putative cardiolipin-specific deacylase, mitochondrial [Diplogelasinospora grovesii]|uniref:Cardiolipin-specific deacylase, mitochondrial n=1 Tax=Diplogelasinospora grovesii TaxID=303347 RepID=A0AAN6S3I2_9PEZI|nr:putative cardiolipin-specific deacylase, mitochondrial [Diplogelasinospora grovesii]
MATLQRTLLILGLLTGASAGAGHLAGSRCSEVSFAVPVSSENVVFGSPPDPHNDTAIVEFMLDVWRGLPANTTGTTTVTGNFTVNGLYCEPRGQKRKADTLEVLVHGITYNKTMWSGMGFGSPYDWLAYANSRGYAALSIDRVGHGTNPERPDPLNVVQPQLHVETLHYLFNAARSGHNRAFGGRNFDKVVFVGHSYGCFLGTALASQHPGDADAMVLTGFATTIDFSDVTNAQWAGAAHVMPQRFAGVPLGYVALVQQAQRTASFYAGAYDPAIPPVDFAYEDTLSCGEVGALGSILQPAAGYANPVLVVTAVDDAFFCKPPKATCEGILATSASYFPNVTDYSYFAPENTGHDLTLHYSAPATFKQVHDWLDQRTR